MASCMVYEKTEMIRYGFTFTITHHKKNNNEGGARFVITYKKPI